MNIKDIIEDINSLPPLSDVHYLIYPFSKYKRETISVSKLVSMIESDAILAANILRMINAPYYGFSKKIASVTQAVTLFGTDMIYGLLLNYAIQTTLKANVRPYCLSNEQFNEICHLQSSLTLQWYSKVDEESARLLAPLALIMETGKLVVSREIVRSSLIKEFSLGIKQTDNITLYEDSLFGSSSYYVSGLLFEHWNMRPLYVAILKGLDYEYDTLVEIDEYIDVLDVIRTAVNIKDPLSYKSLDQAAQLVEAMRLNADDFLKVAKALKRYYEY